MILHRLYGRADYGLPVGGTKRTSSSGKWKL